MANIISFANQKGGVGKTMTIAATASILTSEGNKVLLIDLDAQRNLDMVAGHYGESPLAIPRDNTEMLSILNVLKGECGIEEAIVPSAIGDLVRSSNHLYGWSGSNLLKEADFFSFLKEWKSIEEIVKKQSPGKPSFSESDLYILQAAISKGTSILSQRGKLNLPQLLEDKPYDYKILEKAVAKVKDQYDYILIDTNPSLTLLTLNALYACNYVVIPTFPEASSMEAIMELTETIAAITEHDSQRHLEVLGVLMTKYNPHRKKSKRNAEILKDLVQNYIHTHLFQTMIRETERASEYVEANLDIVRHDPTGQTAMDYHDFVSELKLRLSGMRKEDKT